MPNVELNTGLTHKSAYLTKAPEYSHSQQRSEHVVHIERLLLLGIVKRSILEEWSYFRLNKDLLNFFTMTTKGRIY